MSKNFEVVSLILKDPKEIAVWLNESRITEDDVKAAVQYIKDQEILPEEKLKEIIKYIEITIKFYKGLGLAHNSGMSVEEITKICEKHFGEVE